MRLYYFANQIYQYSYALPIYRAAGGKFIAKSLKRIVQFKRHLAGANVSGDVKTFLDAPPFIKCTAKNVHKLEGIVLSMSNAAIHSDRRRCQTIFVGHGTGDKPYGPNEHLLYGYDYHFIAGPKHLEKLRDLKIEIPDEKLIKIGNPRFDDYVNGKIDRNRELERLGIVDRSRKNVLYAPTWQWGAGTLHQFVYRFAREITQRYNLIVRPHHHDRKYIPRIRWWAKWHGIEHVYFSNPTALVKSDTMNDFLVSDILISDTSSILYEYLITRQPIIVIKTDFKDLHHMPDEMNIMNYATHYDGSQNIVELIEENLQSQRFRKDYEKLLHNCFYFNDGRSVERAVAFIRSLA
jgi:hypothetical protein